MTKYGIKRCWAIFGQLIVFVLCALCMISLYFMKAGAFSCLFVFGMWLALLFGVLKFVKCEGFLNFFLICFFFFPKKTIAENRWGGLLADYFGSPSPVVLSFYDVVLMPTLIMAGLWLYRRQSAMLLGKNYAYAAIIYCGLAIVGAFNYIAAGVSFPQNYAPLVLGSSIATAAFYLLLKVLAHSYANSQYLLRLYSKLLVLFLFIEYFVAVQGIVPDAIANYMMDYRGGFRSSLLGYSVFVGYFALLALFFAGVDYLKRGKWKDLLVVFMSFALIVSSFERSIILAAVIFATLLSLNAIVFKRYYRYILLLAFLFASLFYIEIQNGFNTRLIALTQNGNAVNEVVTPAATKSTLRGHLAKSTYLKVAEVKGGEFTSVESIWVRFALNLRAIDVFLSAPVAGYGVSSFFITSTSAIQSKFDLEKNTKLSNRYLNVLDREGQANSHNILFEQLAGTGLGVIPFFYMTFIYCFFELIRRLRVEAFDQENRIGAFMMLLSLYFFYQFQAVPQTYFVFVFMATMIAVKCYTSDEIGQ